MSGNDEVVGYYAKPKFSLWGFFGFGECRAPIMHDKDFPELFPGEMRSECYSRLDWKDRVRVLITGRIFVHMRHKTDVNVNHIRTTSALSVLPPKPRQ